MLGSVGLISSSNFFVPQVNLSGSMAAFVPPAAISTSTALARKTGLGLGQFDNKWSVDTPFGRAHRAPWNPANGKARASQ
jgi:hypothetical protein